MSRSITALVWGSDRRDAATRFASTLSGPTITHHKQLPVSAVVGRQTADSPRAVYAVWSGDGAKPAAHYSAKSIEAAVRGAAEIWRRAESAHAFRAQRQAEKTAARRAAQALAAQALAGGKDYSALECVARPIWQALAAKEHGARSVALADVARLIRAELAQTFPDVKFSVRSSSYSGGSSIDVRWTDGPTSTAVDAVLHKYEGKAFDGTIDLAYYKNHWLSPDGRLSLAHSEGTTGSRGCHSEAIGSAHGPDAIMVRLGVDYVHGSRAHSLAAKQAALDYLAEHYGPVSRLHPRPAYVTKIRGGFTYHELETDVPLDSGDFLSNVVRRHLEGTLLRH